MSNLLNLCTEATSSTKGFIDFIFSTPAIITYVVLFFVIIAILIVSLVFSNSKNSKTENITVDKVDLIGGAISGKKSKVDKEEDEEEEEKAEEHDGIRFPELCRIDQEKVKYQRSSYDENVTLREFCEEFRNYAAGKLKLYYDIKDIRQFIAGMAVSKILILQGMSGTGKTSLAYAFGEYVDNESKVISVQPMWKERTDLIGYFNEFTKKFSEMPLLKKMYEANYSRDMYVTVLDEMNIARVEYYFAEFLSLLELPDSEKRKLPVVTSQWDTDPEQLKDGNIKLPDNMWYIGTANNDDSTFAISDKVYDRAMVMDLDKKAEPFVVNEVRNIHITAKRFVEMAEGAQKEYALTRRNRRRLKQLDKYMIEKFHITFGNRIMKQINNYIPVYVSCGGQEIDALDEILSKKVMRKLSTQNPVQVRNASGDFIKYIDDLFGEENMLMCKDVITRIAGNA